MSNFFLFSYGFFVISITFLTFRLAKKVSKLESLLFAMVGVVALQLEINSILSKFAKEGYDKDFEEQIKKILDEGK